MIPHNPSAAIAIIESYSDTPPEEELPEIFIELVEKYKGDPDRRLFSPQ